MSSEEAHGHQKVQLALNLSTSPPHTVSSKDATPAEPPHTVSSKDATPAEPMKLFATIKQTASPFPDRAVIILTKYSCLETDAPGSDGAFSTRAMASPQIVVQDDQCPAPELIMRPTKRVTITRISGDPDLLKRETEDPGFKFITVPPIGQGHVEVV
jgi:hypothetical protein